MSEKARLLNHKTLQDYIAYYEGLNPRNIRLIEKLAEPSIEFQDPFNKVRGLDAVEAIFEHMFTAVEKPKFKVRDAVWSDDNMRAFLKWDCTFERKSKKHHIPGMSEVSFNEKGLIISHIDYWDSGEYFYAKLPVIGALVRWVRSKLEVNL